MDSKIGPESSNKFCCIKCDYNTIRKSQYDRHLSTAKHIRIHMDSKMDTEKVPLLFKCNCGNIYKYRQGLVKHKKKCSQKSLEKTVTETDISNPSFIVNLLKKGKY